MPRRRSAEPRYRRRVVLELTPDESTVLDRLADRHGTIRGAVLAGWRLLRCNPWSHGGVDYARDQSVFPLFRFGKART